MGSQKVLMAGACVLAFCVATTEVSQARSSRCASPVEVTAMQAAAIQQELMDAALTCGDAARVNYNAFQTKFGPELRRSDRAMLRMFTRVMGGSKGSKAYDLFKTELAAKAELRRTKGHDDFCAEANLVVAAALGPQKIALSDFVADVPALDIEGPVGSCDIELTVSFRGAKAMPGVVPRPNPLRVADVASPASAPPPMAPAPVGAGPVPAAPGPAAPAMVTPR